MSALTDKFKYYWKLDETTGNYVDIIAGKTISNTNVTHDASGKVGYCASFNGSNSVGSANTANSGTTTWSAGGWVYANNWNNHSTLFRYTPWIFRFGQTAGNVYIDDGSHVAYSTGGIGTGAWHHVVVTSSATNKTIIYVDGYAVAMTGGYALTINSSSGMVIGASPPDNEWYNGKFDEIFICTGELTAAEVLTVSTSGQYPFLSAPTVTTQAVSDIDKTTATGNGNVTADGGDTVTERGTVYSTSANPTTSDTKDTASGTTGAFTTSIDTLTKGTLYHVRAYAINSIGTSYGSDVTFTTKTDYAPTKGLIYKVRGTPAAKTKSLKYTTKSAPTAKTKSLKYTVPSTPSAKTKTLKYTVTITPSAKTKGVIYHVVLTPSAKTKGLIYKTKSAPSPKTKGLIYDVKSPKSTTKSLQYEIEVEGTKSKSLKYTIKTNVSPITKGLEYRIITVPTPKTKGLIYKVIPSIKKTKSLKYTVPSTPAAITLGLIYIVVERVNITKNLIYKVKAPKDKTKTLKYTVIQTPTAKTKGLHYAIRNVNKTTKGLVYEIEAKPKVTKTLRYTVKGGHVKTKSMTYAINIHRVYPYSKKKSPYSKL